MDGWLDEHGYTKGAVLPLDRVWELAKAWYRGRSDPEWRGRTADEAREILDGVGLTDDFWALS